MNFEVTCIIIIIILYYYYYYHHYSNFKETFVTSAICSSGNWQPSCIIILLSMELYPGLVILQYLGSLSTIHFSGHDLMFPEEGSKTPTQRLFVPSSEGLTLVFP